jgi:hypothetical protein
MTVISEIPPGQDVAAQEKGSESDKIQSRGEKKARQALSKLGLKLQGDISRVTFKRTKNVITSP